MSRLQRKLSKRGDWVKAQLTREDITVIVSVLIVSSLIRAFDYSFGVDSSVQRPVTKQAVSLLNDAFPLIWYGIALGVANSVLIVGSAIRKHIVVWLGHGLCMVLYTVLFIGTTVPIIHTPYLDGIRGATTLVIPGLIHLLLWLRTGPRPLTAEEGTDAQTMKRPS